MNSNKKGFKTKKLFTLQVKVAIFAALAIFLTASIMSIVILKLQDTYLTTETERRTQAIITSSFNNINPEVYYNLKTKDDEKTQLFTTNHNFLKQIKLTSDVQFLYIAKYDEDKNIVYALDSENMDSQYYSSPGEPMDVETIDTVKIALEGDVYKSSTMETGKWGILYGIYVPIYNQTNDKVVAALCIEYDSSNTYFFIKKLFAIGFVLIISLTLVFSILSLFLFKHVSAEYFKKIAFTDALTGMGNRMAYDNYINDLSFDDFKKCSLSVVDINKLKFFNDTYGHNVGDTYIVSTANLIEEGLGNDGKIFRIGGDEFVVIATNPDIFMKKVFDDILENKKIILKNQEIKPNFSYGVAKFDYSLDKNVKSVFTRADERMYEMKVFSRTKDE